MSEQYNVELLGELPINTKIREYGDTGKPIVLSDPGSDESEAFINIAKRLIKEVNILNSSESAVPSLEIEI